MFDTTVSPSRTYTILMAGEGDKKFLSTFVLPIDIEYRSVDNNSDTAESYFASKLYEVSGSTGCIVGCMAAENIEDLNKLQDLDDILKGPFRTRDTNFAIQLGSWYGAFETKVFQNPNHNGIDFRLVKGLISREQMISILQGDENARRAFRLLVAAKIKLSS